MNVGVFMQLLVLYAARVLLQPRLGFLKAPAFNVEAYLLVTVWGFNYFVHMSRVRELRSDVLLSVSSTQAFCILERWIPYDR